MNATLAAFSTDVLERDLNPSPSDTVNKDERWTGPYEDRSSWPSPVMQNTAQVTDVTFVIKRSGWLIQAFKKLNQLMALGADWDTYQSEAPSEQTIRLAREVLRTLADEDFAPSSLDPSSEGGVSLSFRNGDRYSDIECFNSGEVLAVVSRAGQDTDVWELNNLADDLPQAINRIRSFLGK